MNKINEIFCVFNNVSIMRNGAGQLHNENGPAVKRYYESGELLTETYYKNDKKHNENGPADISYYKNGRIKNAQYYIDGKLTDIAHFDRAASLHGRFLKILNNQKTKYKQDMSMSIKRKTKIRNWKGELHNESGPALIEMFDTGELKKESYYTNGVLNRKDGPAIVSYYENGNISYEEYYKNGTRHNESSPAYIEYYPSTSVMFKSFYKNDKLHNINGPAQISYFKNGQIKKENYYINGIKTRLVSRVVQRV